MVGLLTILVAALIWPFRSKMLSNNLIAVVLVALSPIGQLYIGSFPSGIFAALIQYSVLLYSVAMYGEVPVTFAASFFVGSIILFFRLNRDR